MPVPAPATSEGAPVLVRNLERGPSVFTDPFTKQAIEWKGFGDQAGEDYQYVPLSLVQHPAFLKAMTKRIFEVVGADAETEAALQSQAEAWRRRQEIIDQNAALSIDTEGQRELAHVAIDDKGQITGVPGVVGVQTDAEGMIHSQTETTIPVIIEESAHAAKARRATQ
jgi:hypothetical protein